MTGTDGPAPNAWSFDYSGFAPADEGRREALCTLGNGVFATRGAAPESRESAVHYPGTYVAGLYNRLVSEVQDRVLEHESMVNVANWLPLDFRAPGGDWLDLSTMHVEGFHQELDLRRGILNRRFEVTDSGGHTTALAERRIVHMGCPHLAALEWTLTPRNWSGLLEVRSGLDGDVENRNVADERELAGRHLTQVRMGAHGSDVLWMTTRTTRSERHIGLACRTAVTVDGAVAGVDRRTGTGERRIDHHMEVQVAAGRPVVVEKVVTLATTLDHAIADVRTAALDHLDDAGRPAELIATHELAWEHLWQQAHLDLRSPDPEVMTTLNLHVFHLLQTLSPHIVDRDVGVTARGLHGEGYRGHVFWDELFVFPYLNLRFPALTRELLLYRYRRLPAARRQAAAMGCRGARYPWQSGSDGSEQTPTEFYNPRSGRWMVDNSRRQHHVGLAVALGVWQYYQVSADLDFLTDFGAELLIEVARFWVDLAELDPATGRYSIRGVMGPDEFHDGYPGRPGEGIDDNAYTNVMVSWLLRRAIEVHELLGVSGADVWHRLDLAPEELATWDRVSRRLRVVFHDDGMISQFAGYEKLPELDWERYRQHYGNIGRLDLILEAEGDSTNHYKAAKQADVLMLLYLFPASELSEMLAHLGYEFDSARVPEVVDYYTARMTHGSTLCRVAMAWVLARTDRARSWAIFREALHSDVADIQGGTTQEGIHLAAMAGTLDLVQRCYAGLEARHDTLWFDPRLPDELTELRFGFRYRDQHIDVCITHRHLELDARHGPRSMPVTVAVGTRRFELRPGASIVIDLPGPSSVGTRTDTAKGPPGPHEEAPNR